MNRYRRILAIPIAALLALALATPAVRRGSRGAVTRVEAGGRRSASDG